MIVMLSALTQWAALSVFAELGFKEMASTALVSNVAAYGVSLHTHPSVF